jgi:hypothetical protein
MTAALWVFRRHWHPDKRPWARLRALLLILSDYETEICGRCGGKVGMVWHAPDELWLAGNGMGRDAGVLCVRCFNLLAERSGLSLYWECASGNFPSCTGSPCAHEETMIIAAEQRDEIWKQRQEYRRQRDEYWDQVLALTAPRRKDASLG